MKKSYYLLIFLILLFVCGKSYAQMQGINASSERYTHSLQTLGEFVKVENIDNRSILTLSKDINSNYSTFVRTKMGTNYITIGRPLNPRFDVYDFKIFDDFVYFCGNYSGCGFIAWGKLDDIFNNGQFNYELLNTTTVVYNLEVFRDHIDGYPKVVALGYNTSNQRYSFINYNVWNNPGTYNVYECPFKLQNLTQTDGYIAVVCSRDQPPYEDFGIIRHDKTNISNCQGRVFKFDNNGIATGDIFGRLPEANKPSYLIEWIEGSPNIMVATCIDQIKSNFGSSAYPIALFNINLNSLSLYSTQVIPNFGKPYVKDMTYIAYDSTMHLIVNGQFGNTYSTVPYSDWTYTDFIHKIEVWNTIGYYPEIILPNSNVGKSEVLNSITKYDKYYYIIGGRLSNNNELYWFDRKFDISSGQCYKRYEIKVDFDHPLPLGNINYYPTPIPSNVNQEHFYSYSDKYMNICLD